MVDRAMENSSQETMTSVGKVVKVSAQRERDEHPQVAQKQGFQFALSSAERRRSVDSSTTTRRGVKSSAGFLLEFSAKLIALEALRRGSQAKCRLLWWGLQGLAVSGAPALGWFRRWAPFRVLADASESFSKPMIFLSLATVLANAYNEARERKTTGKTDTAPTVDLSVIDTTRSDSKETKPLINVKQSPPVAFMKEELSKHGVIYPESVDDGEVERFWYASNGDTAKFVTIMRKTLEWRKTYDFMPQSELRVWSPLVFWHLRDAHGRPILIIRLGLVWTTLTPAQRPQFAQAVISQVENGVRNLVTTHDARIIVVMDCRGTTAFGFPVQMMKSCVVLVQEHYPMRLAALFVVNAPPLVRAMANAIIRVLKPTTREKVRVEGDKFIAILANFFGDSTKVPAALGGNCSCPLCVAKPGSEISFMDSLALQKAVQPEYHRNLQHSEERACEAIVTAQQTNLQTLRVIILALVCLWILIAVATGRS